MGDLGEDRFQMFLQRGASPGLTDPRGKALRSEERDLRLVQGEDVTGDGAA